MSEIQDKNGEYRRQQLKEIVKDLDEGSDINAVRRRFAEPIDVTYMDEHDQVRYYSQGRVRIFPRSPAVIGRAVQNCHPPASVHIVEKILESFRSKEKNIAEFWLSLGERFIHIRYFAPLLDW